MRNVPHMRRVCIQRARLINGLTHMQQLRQAIYAAAKHKDAPAAAARASVIALGADARERVPYRRKFNYGSLEQPGSPLDAGEFALGDKDAV